MDYETRYKAARERAKEMCAMPTDKATMEYIFPELKESGGDDNESIRKAIIEMVHDTKDVVCEAYNVSKEDVLAWLVKQDEQKTTEWSEESKQIILSIEQVMNCASLLNIATEKIDKIKSWLKSLRPQEQRQVKKSATFQHEDKTCKENCNFLTRKLDSAKVIK